MLPGLLVGLFSPDPDELFEDVAHLHIVDTLRREVDFGIGKRLHHLIENVLLGHAQHVLAEIEALHDLADVRREGIDVAVQIGGELVRVIQQPGEVELREVVELRAGNLAELGADDVFTLALERLVRIEHGLLGGRKNAVESPEHRQRQNDLAVLVPLVRTPEQVADAPDEISHLRVGFRRHRHSFLFFNQILRFFA